MKHKVKHVSLKSLHKKAWDLQSKYIRQVENGICYTCGTQQDWKEMQAGHYIHNKLDFDLINIHCQCVRCNKWLSGNEGIYAERLISEYGLDAVLDLRWRANEEKKGRKYTITELENLILLYTERLKDLKEK